MLLKRSDSQRSEVVTLMYVPGVAGNIRRVNLRRTWIRRIAIAAIGTVVSMAVLTVDYVKVRIELQELDHLRAETTEQRQQIEGYADAMGSIFPRPTTGSNGHSTVRAPWSGEERTRTWY